MKGLLKNRYFWTAFTVTLIIIFFIFAVIIVDYNCRAAAFNDTSPIFEITKKSSETLVAINLFGKKETFNISGAANLWYFIADFICFPHG